eukprot:TRINITY_DN11151_c0_g1_i1.p1 TRINITY_DN11151_c0_g1~~TRINITY_DN11151_c0_g1_i1.p1  ORF type:complete len:357 (+),score=84.18 TRINITY_DN11151_c0_g1_i1:27-1073(+)
MCVDLRGVFSLLLLLSYVTYAAFVSTLGGDAGGGGEGDGGSGSGGLPSFLAFVTPAFVVEVLMGKVPALLRRFLWLLLGFLSQYLLPTAPFNFILSLIGSLSPFVMLGEAVSLVSFVLLVSASTESIRHRGGLFLAIHGSASIVSLILFLITCLQTAIVDEASQLSLFFALVFFFLLVVVMTVATLQENLVFSEAAVVSLYAAICIFFAVSGYSLANGPLTASWLKHAGYASLGYSDAFAGDVDVLLSWPSVASKSLFVLSIIAIPFLMSADSLISEVDRLGEASTRFKISPQSRLGNIAPLLIFVLLILNLHGVFTATHSFGFWLRALVALGLYGGRARVQLADSGY